MKISNKIESYEKIIELNLNRFPEKIFKKGEKDSVIEFLNTYHAEYYAVRDKSKARGMFKLKVKREDILNEISEYQLFSINVSSYNYRNHQKLVGEIFISDSNVSAILSTNNTYSVRDASSNPDYNISTTIFDDNLDNIPHFNDVYKYIIENKLKDTIVEFAYYDVPVGINYENIVIYELRTDY